MGAKTDTAKGRTKRAVGDATGNKRLQREGEMDQASGRAKQAAHDVGKEIDEGVDAVKRTVKDRGRH